jgi:hypothetical protein
VVLAPAGRIRHQMTAWVKSFARPSSSSFRKSA